MRSAAQLHPVLGRLVRRMDVDHLSIAEIWRQTSVVAGEHGLYRPGYHAVLAIVRDERSRRALRRAALVDAVDELWAYKGIDYGKLARRLGETRCPS